MNSKSPLVRVNISITKANLALQTRYASRTSCRQPNWHRRPSQSRRPSLTLFNIKPLLPPSSTSHEVGSHIELSLLHREPSLIECRHVNQPCIALFFHGHLEVCLGRGVIILEKGKHINCLFEQHTSRESYTLLVLVLYDNESLGWKRMEWASTEPWEWEHQYQTEHHHTRRII